MLSNRPSPMQHAAPARSPRQAARFEDTIDRTARRALEQFSPADVVIDRAGDIIRFSGGTIGRFLEPSPGVASSDLFGILRRALRPSTRSAVAQATEPFFSTKPPGLGSGLGLSMIYGFAQQSGGQLRIDSEVGVGTTVRLYLPRAQPDNIDRPVVSGASVSSPGGDEAILLVDDNTTLRDVARRNLIALGYNVSLADSGPAAMALLQAGARFHLLFTDIMMPQGMTGYALAEAARALQPDLCVLLTTGYDGEVNNGNHEALPILRTPYRRHELAEAVRTTLDSGGGG
jgi:CheY-like chemotaxis protein